MHIRSLLAAIVLAIAACPTAFAARATLLDTHDVFNQLQQNVWYLPTRDHVARLYVTEIGQGKPVIFLHGGPGNDFNYIIDALRPHLARHRFVLFDQRGSLLSPVPPGMASKVTLDQLVDDLETLRVALGLDKLTLFGHSYGTVLAMAYYRAHPQHVERLVLAGALPPAMPPGGAAALDKVMDPRQQALMQRPEVAKTLAAAGLPADPQADTPQQARIRQRIQGNAPSNIIDMRRWRELTGAGVYYNAVVSNAIQASVPGDLDIRPTLRKTPVPITVIQGDRDYVDPGAHAWAALVPTGWVVIRIMPAASHYAWIDQPRAFAKALGEGLDRTTTDPGPERAH